MSEPYSKITGTLWAGKAFKLDDYECYIFVHSPSYQLLVNIDLKYVIFVPYEVNKTTLRAPCPYIIHANSQLLSFNGLSLMTAFPVFIKHPGNCLRFKAIFKIVPEVYSTLFKARTSFAVFFWLVFYKINFENSGPSGPFIIHKNTF